MTNWRTKFVNRYVRTYLGETPKGSNTFLGLCLVTVAFSLGLGVLPALQTVITTRANISYGEASNTKLDAIIKDLKSGEANLIKESAKLELLNKYVPPQEDLGSLVERVTILASQNNVNLEFYQKDKAGGTSYWLGIAGSYSNLKKMITGIETGYPLSKIESVTLNMPSNEKAGIKGLILVSTFKL